MILDMLKVAFIEDDPVYRQSISASLRLQPDITCLVSAGSVEEFWEALPSRAEIDILFLDIDLPGQSGLEALPALRQRFPRADLIMLTQFERQGATASGFQFWRNGIFVKGLSCFAITFLHPDRPKRRGSDLSANGAVGHRIFQSSQNGPGITDGKRTSVAEPFRRRPFLPGSGPNSGHIGRRGKVLC